ncbi:MAG: DUF6036 family nucleotidyltransferase [Gemmataceae bacterium]
MNDLWDLVWGKPSIDPGELAAAIDRAALRDDLDVRTRLLLRDGAKALTQYRGGDWSFAEGTRRRLAAIEAEALGPVKFPSIRERLMGHTKPEAIEQMLRELGTRLGSGAKVVIGGAASLILQGNLSRATEDIDVVDEVPAEIREDHSLLDELRRRYGLALTHFQSHDLPRGWEGRAHSLGPFGRLQVAVVDMHDLFLGKLFSRRPKDLDDLRHLLPQTDRGAVPRRLREDCASFLAEPALRAHAERNWYILTGEPLPVA